MLRSLSWIPVFALFMGCGFLKEPGTPLAKVKDRTLTLEELSARGEQGRDSVMARVTEWVNQQVLVQEAMAMGLQNEPDVVWLLRDAERKILLDAFNRRFEKTLAEPEEGELELYFEKHRDEFMREEPTFRFISHRYPSLAEARIAVKFLADSGLVSPDSLPWISSASIGTCFRGILATLKPGGWSIPQICGDSAVVLRLVGLKPVGEPLEYAEARSAAIHSVRREHRQRKLDSLLQEAKSRQAVFTWPENLPPK